MAKTRIKPFSRLTMAAALLALAGCRGGTPQTGVSVEHVWVRLPAVAGGAGAGYFAATAPADDALLAVTTRGARIELHESMTHEGMTSMRPLRTVALPAGDEVRFAPGGKHLMIFGLDRGLKKGGTLPLTFRFRASPAVTVNARLVGAGDAPPEDAEG